MYRSDLNRRDRSGALAAVIAVHVGLLLILLHISGKIERHHLRRRYRL